MPDDAPQYTATAYGSCSESESDVELSSAGDIAVVLVVVKYRKHGAERGLYTPAGMKSVPRHPYVGAQVRGARV